jgi:oxygen-independent coproporphyrinogen III oxidase
MAGCICGFEMDPRAAYLHVPFCRRRCGYCNFTVVARRDDLIAAYLQALQRELSWLRVPRVVETLFLGGGTPTHLPAADLACLLRLARSWFVLTPDYEFSIEANPSDLTADKIAILTQAGVNRISLGVQSFDDAKLAQLERDHRRQQALDAVATVAGRFRSVAVDLIFAVPGETLDVWEADLQTMLALRLDHVSTYGLTFDKGSAFWGRRARGPLVAVDEERERAMYETAIDTLSQAGWDHYEVSNFARPGQHCRHNQTYWRGGSYFAAGPGAARFVDGWRETNHRSTTKYLQRVLAGQSPVAERERLAPEDAARERLVFGLRMLAGVDCRTFHEQTGFHVERLVGRAVADCMRWGLLEMVDERLRLTRRGLLVSDAIWPHFLG